jgi:hypothetical protein
MSHCNLLTPVYQLSPNNWSARMSFSQVKQVFTVEQYLASHSYLTCQNEFMDTFPDSPVPNKSKVSHLVNHFHDTRSTHDRNHSILPSGWSDNSLDNICQTSLHSPWKTEKTFSSEWTILQKCKWGYTDSKTSFISCMSCTNSKNLTRKKHQYCTWFTHSIQGGRNILTWFHLYGDMITTTTDYSVLKTAHLP